MLYSLIILPILSFNIVAWQNDTSHDFGDLILYENYKHEFIFKNISDEEIRIDNIRPSCGCTIPDWNRDPIAPDSSAIIKVAFRPRTTGYTRKLIKVYFNSQKQAEKLYVEAYVQRK